HCVGVLERADTALRDSIDVARRAAMRDGTLERIFRRWQVWDADQGELFKRAAGPDIAVEAVAGAQHAAPLQRGSVLAYLPSLGRAAALTGLLSVLSMSGAVGLGLVGASRRVSGAAPLRAA